MACSLCEKMEVEFWFGKYCKDCRKIKHYLNLHHERVYEILDRVLGRNLEGQEKMVGEEIKKEIEEKTYNLRKK